MNRLNPHKQDIWVASLTKRIIPTSIRARIWIFSKSDNHVKEIDKISSKKDWWDKFKIISEFLIALAIGTSTVAFSYLSYQNDLRNKGLTLKLAEIDDEREKRISEFNIKMAELNYQREQQATKLNTETTLVPYLLDKDSGKRSDALRLAEILDKEFAAKAADVLSRIDQNKDVQDTAKSALVNLSQSENEVARKIANESIDKQIIIDELRSLGFIKKLTDAKNYSAMGGDENYEKSLELYRDVVNKLSYNTLRKIDKQLLFAAQQDEKTGNKELAARKYDSLFSEYIIDTQKQ